MASSSSGHRTAKSQRIGSRRLGFEIVVSTARIVEVVGCDSPCRTTQLSAPSIKEFSPSDNACQEIFSHNLKYRFLTQSECGELNTMGERL